MKLKHYPASAFLSDETFDRLLRCVKPPVDPEFENDLRTFYRRNRRVRMLRFLRTPAVRRIESSTARTVDQLEGLSDAGRPGVFLA